MMGYNAGSGGATKSTVSRLGFQTDPCLHVNRMFQFQFAYEITIDVSFVGGRRWLFVTSRSDEEAENVGPRS